MLVKVTIRIDQFSVVKSKNSIKTNYKKPDYRYDNFKRIFFLESSADKSLLNTFILNRTIIQLVESANFVSYIYTVLAIS